MRERASDEHFKRLAAPTRGPGFRATIFCSASNGKYQVLCDRAGKPDADPLDYRYDAERGGIWVALDWMHGR